VIVKDQDVYSTEGGRCDATF